MIRFSIIIPLYNKEKHIKTTLKSVLAQTYPDFEIIIVNDGSTDNGMEEVNSIKDERIRLFNIENHGVSFARNYGIEKANADFIAFLDADDYWYPSHLEDLERLYRTFPNCGMYATAYSKKINTIEISNVFHKIPKTVDWIGIVDDFFESSKINCIAWTSAVMIPSYVFKMVGSFDETITFGAGEDTDLWIRIALKYPVAFCNTVSAIYQLQADNRISNTNTNLRNFINLDVYEEQAKTNKSLKTYLDLNRFSLAIQYKLIGNEVKAKTYIEKIDQRNLNAKQRLLLRMNTPLLKGLLKVKNLLQRNGFQLSSFR